MPFGHAVLMSAWYRMDFHSASRNCLPSHCYVASPSQCWDLCPEENHSAFVSSRHIGEHREVHTCEKRLIGLGKVPPSEVNVRIELVGRRQATQRSDHTAEIAVHT